MILAGAGCITGDTVINFNRCKKGFKKTIRGAFKSFNQKEDNWDLQHPTYVRSFKGHDIRLHKVIGIVRSGRRVVYRLTLENGRSLKATSDHKIMTQEGFVPLGKLAKSEHLVMCDTLKAKKKLNKKAKRIDKVTRSLKYYPYGYQDKPGKKRVEEYRLAYEADLNGYTLADFILILRTDAKKSKGFKFINPKIFDIHHADSNWENNDPDNLVKLTRQDHKRIHKNGQYDCFNQGVPEYSKIESIKEVGDKMTYDIQCEAPFHNFVANGMVIHNSGKTSTLTRKIAHLIELGVPSGRIMATTFTKKSSEEMKERLVELVGKENVNSLRVGTFHSLFYKIYRDILANRNKKYPSLLKDGQKWMVLKTILDKIEKTKPPYRVSKDVNGCMTYISSWKNLGWKHAQLLKMDSTAEINVRGFVEAYRLYEIYMEENNKIDFDDMLLKTFYELRKKTNQGFLKRLRRKIKYLLVDEFQDSNRIQLALVDIVLGDNQNITTVGDDWQILYSWRGASIDLIKSFKNSREFSIFKLEQNYRSSQKIVEAGNNLIKHNANQFEKTLFTENEVGEDLSIRYVNCPDEEAEYVFETIQDLVIEKGYNFSDIAIVYRINSQSRAIVDNFIGNNIPHRVYSEFGFYDRAEVKDIISYIRIFNNSYEAEYSDFRRVINKPARYLGEAALRKVEDFQEDNDYASFWQALENYNQCDSLTYNQKNNIGKFVTEIETVHKWMLKSPPSTEGLIGAVLHDIGYKKFVESSDEVEDADNDKKLNLDSLLAGASRFPNPDHFLDFVASMKEKKKKLDDYVHVMTVHKSKGKEFPIVFLIGLSDKMLPFYKAKTQAALEEERRICYVAITRAENKVYLSSILGKFGRLNVKPSQFIGEMGLPMRKAEVIRRPGGAL